MSPLTLTNGTSESRIDLARLENAVQGQPRLEVETKHTLEPAHGEEVVRSLFIDDQVIAVTLLLLQIANLAQSGVIYSAGEDGHIKAFRPSGFAETPKTSKISKPKKTPSDQRYKPY